MRRAPARLLAAAAIGAALAGCSREGEVTVPVACKEGPDAIDAALRRAPGEVRVGGTRISECLAQRSESADVQAVGASLIAVVERLAADARRRPDGDAARRLGYVMGAVRRGAARSQGIHDELVRRLEQELIGLDTATAAFREGEAAGRRSG